MDTTSLSLQFPSKSEWRLMRAQYTKVTVLIGMEGLNHTKLVTIPRTGTVGELLKLVYRLENCNTSLTPGLDNQNSTKGIDRKSLAGLCRVLFDSHGMLEYLPPSFRRSLHPSPARRG
jgi:hypothetical protein